MKINGEIVKAEVKAVGGQAGNTNAGKRLDTTDPIVSDNKPKSTIEKVSREIGVTEVIRMSTKRGGRYENVIQNKRSLQEYARREKARQQNKMKKTSTEVRR